MVSGIEGKLLFPVDLNYGLMEVPSRTDVRVFKECVTGDVHLCDDLDYGELWITLIRLLRIKLVTRHDYTP